MHSPHLVIFWISFIPFQFALLQFVYSFSICFIVNVFNTYSFDMIFCSFAFICILNSKGINLLPDHFALFLFASCPIQCTFALAGKVIFWNSFIPFQFALLQFVESFSIRLLLMYYSFPISFVVIIFVISLFLYF